MPISTTPMVERIARVLAGLHLSENAEGFASHAGASVDMEWRDYVADAAAVLRTMREPDETMARTGDVAVWETMVTAALARPPAEPEGNPLAPPIIIGAGS